MGIVANNQSRWHITWTVVNIQFKHTVNMQSMWHIAWA